MERVVWPQLMTRKVFIKVKASDSQTIVCRLRTLGGSFNSISEAAVVSNATA